MPVMTVHGEKRLQQHAIGNHGVRLFEKWFNVYAIVADDGRLITAAWRIRRLWRV